MGFWIDYNISKIFPGMGRTKIWYLILDNNHNWNLGIANIKKAEKKFKWKNKDYQIIGTPEPIAFGENKKIKLNDNEEYPPIPVEFETSLNARIFIYQEDCSFPLNVAFEPSAEHLVSFREQAETDQIKSANQERRAFVKASLLMRKKDQNVLIWLLAAMGLQSMIIIYFLLQIMEKFPK